MKGVHDGDRKTYGQMCSLAMALDRVGDRWTILILRELLGGRARFGELRTSLPGIATNLLSTRLRRMVDDGLVARTGSGQQTVYELTEIGAAIRPALEALGQWGHMLGPQGPARPVTAARSLAMPLTAALGWAAEMGVDLGDATMRLDTDNGSLGVRGGREPGVSTTIPEAPDAVATTTVEAMASFMLEGRFVPGSVVHAEGDEAVTQRFCELLAGVASQASTPDWVG